MRTTLPPLFQSLLLIFLLHTFVTLANDPPPPDASAEYTQDNDFRSAILDITNTYRRQHNASALHWNDTLEEIARTWSEGCVFRHSGGPTGENLASGYPNASASIIAWGRERRFYNFRKGEFSKKTGHFTQLVWKKTTSLGCGRTFCNNRDNRGAYGWFVVCEYWPHGNVLGGFGENVQERVAEDEDEGEGEVIPGDGGGDEEGKCPLGAICGDEGEGGKEECPLGALCGGADAGRRRIFLGKGIWGLAIWVVGVVLYQSGTEAFL